MPSTTSLTVTYPHTLGGRVKLCPKSVFVCHTLAMYGRELAYQCCTLLQSGYSCSQNIQQFFLSGTNPERNLFLLKVMWGWLKVFGFEEYLFYSTYRWVFGVATLLQTHFHPVGCEAKRTLMYHLWPTDRSAEVNTFSTPLDPTVFLHQPRLIPYSSTILFSLLSHLYFRIDLTHFSSCLFSFILLFVLGISSLWNKKKTYQLWSPSIPH